MSSKFFFVKIYHVFNQEMQKQKGQSAINVFRRGVLSVKSKEKEKKFEKLKSHRSFS